MLVDAGTLLAILDSRDQAHTICTDTLRKLSVPLVTTWPSFTEAIHLLLSHSGWIGQDLLWKIVLRGELILHDLDEATTQRAYAVMKKYRDVPMDLADATLVALAEALGESQIFTLDSDFLIYKINGRKAFEVVP